jgi:hypothetical protein
MELNVTLLKGREISFIGGESSFIGGGNSFIGGEVAL